VSCISICTVHTMQAYGVFISKFPTHIFLVVLQTNGTKWSFCFASCPWNYISKTKRLFRVKRKERVQNTKQCVHGSNVVKHAFDHVIGFDNCYDHWLRKQSHQKYMRIMAHGQNCWGWQQLTPTPETIQHSFKQTLTLALLAFLRTSFLHEFLIHANYSRCSNF